MLPEVSTNSRAAMRGSRGGGVPASGAGGEVGRSIGFARGAAVPDDSLQAASAIAAASATATARPASTPSARAPPVHAVAIPAFDLALVIIES